jgi:hypothetical protein
VRGPEGATFGLCAQRIHKDWVDVFERPSDALRDAGVTPLTSEPAMLAKRLLSLHAENRAMREEVEALKATHSREVFALRRSVHDHASASEEQVRLEVRRVRREAAEDVEHARRLAEDSRAELRRVEAGATEAVRRAVEEAVGRVVATERARADEEVAAATARADAATARAEAVLRTAEADARAAAEREAQARTEAAETEARANAAVQTARAAQRRAEGEFAEVRRACEERMREAEKQYRESVAANRVKALEGHCVWLERRVAELQGLVESMKEALLHQGPLPRTAPPESEALLHQGPLPRTAPPEPEAPLETFTRPGSGRDGGKTRGEVSHAQRRQGGRSFGGPSVLAWVEPAQGGVGGAVFAARLRDGSAASSASTRRLRAMDAKRSRAVCVHE